MTQQFNTITDALKWCIDNPGQRCRDAAGREVWFLVDSESDSNIRFYTNIDSDGNTVRYEEFNLFPSDLEHFDLTTLRPVEPEPEKPTLENLAALDIEGILKRVSELEKRFEEARRFPSIYPYVGYPIFFSSAGWPVEFGRDEA